ncbi:proton-coupled folate transporter-like [Saccostrea echinata]|uniref:proton-coupled folate transporter-like n=1 Tax=Saccostrea echinata TaxID=191078 RepID=UPI002A80697B|nr:proton-coupled folate transporter-like [Saccostrea echinata]
MKSEIREDYLRIFVPLCAANFCLFFSIVMCTYTASEYGHDTFWNLKFPNRTASNSTDKSLCDTNTSSQGYKDEQIVQKTVARWNVYISIAQGVPLVLSSVIFSPLSDSIGRRPFLFLGSFGAGIKQLLMTLAIVFQWNVYLFIPFTLIEGLCGSWVAQLAVAMSVVSDLTTAGKSRSYLIAVFSFVFGVGFSLGTFVSGYVVMLLGYDYSMAVSSGMSAVAFIIAYFIPETISVQQRQSSRFSCMGNFKNILRFYLKNDPDDLSSTRWKYNTAILSFIFIMMSKLGIFAVETFYLLNSPFCFNPETISIFETAKTCLSEIIILVGIRLMQQYLPDETIALFGTISSIGYCVLFGMASSNIYLYIGAAVGTMGMSSIPMIRGVMSKMTPPHKQGTLFGSLAIVENICNLTGSVLGGAIYSETVSFYRGTVYLVFAGFAFLALILLIFLMKDSRRVYIQKENTIKCTTN